jgi:hypothetical protein
MQLGLPGESFALTIHGSYPPKTTRKPRFRMGTFFYRLAVHLYRYDRRHRQSGRELLIESSMAQSVNLRFRLGTRPNEGGA